MSDEPKASDFIGCLISIKLRDEDDNIIGVVSLIDTENSIIKLTNAVKNGVSLPEGFSLNSGMIDDLEVISTSKEEVQEKPKRSNKERERPHKKSSGDEYENNHNYCPKPLFRSIGDYSNNQHQQQQTTEPKIIYSATDFESQVIAANFSTKKKTQPQPQQFVNDCPFGSSPKAKVIKPKPVINLFGDGEFKLKAPKQSLQHHQHQSQESHIEIFKKFEAPNTFSKNSNSNNNNNNGNSNNNNKVISNDEFNALFSSLTMKGKPSSSFSNTNNTNTNNIKTQQYPNANRIGPRGGAAFEMSTEQIKSEEFDFEKNLADFQKLPVTIKPKSQGKGTTDKGHSIQPPVEDNIQSRLMISLAQLLNKPEADKDKVKPKPKYDNSESKDTTTEKERTVQSIRINSLNGIEAKHYVTDCGVVVPSITIEKRNKIFNTSHQNGFNYERIFEAFSRGIVQISIPLLGDSYRLSPERPEEDRPKVLIWAPEDCYHKWYLDVAQSTARILASLGVRTYLYGLDGYKESFSVEEELYKLTGEYYSNDVQDLLTQSRNFDLIINASTVSPVPDQLFKQKGIPEILIDPRECTTINLPKSNNDLKKVFLLAPCIPLEYKINTSKNVKIFLVNIGLPKGTYEANDIQYKSPFGDRLAIQLFDVKK